MSENNDRESSADRRKFLKFAGVAGAAASTLPFSGSGSATERSKGLPPMAMQNPHFQLRTNSKVLKVNLGSTGEKAVSATYLDARGREMEQPADHYSFGLCPGERASTAAFGNWKTLRRNYWQGRGSDATTPIRPAAEQRHISTKKRS